MATGPSYISYLYEMPSGHTEEVGFVFSIDCFVMLGVKGGGGCLVGVACVVLCLFSYRRYSVVVWRWMC